MKDRHNYFWQNILIALLLLCIPAQVVLGQDKKEENKRYLRGKVTDSDGIPLMSSTVQIKSLKRYAGTDINGNYVIELPKEPVEVIFTFVGMEPHKKTITETEGDVVYNVVLRPNESQLKEVVVTGIFTRPQESFTGSAVTVTQKDLKRVGNQNVLQSLKNIDPTIYIPDNFLSGSDPNTLPEISMRGTSSISDIGSSEIRGRYSNQPNQPLFILDGFEASLSTIMDLDMNRVESVTILKDASAKAIYGSKAANGVIVIETKKLKGNKQRISYNGNLNLEIPDLSSYNLTNSLEKLDVELAEGYYDSTDLPSREEKMRLYNQRKKRALEGLDTYWLAKPLRTGVGQKHTISVELGDAKSLRSTVDFSYNMIGGAMKGSYRRSLSTTANISYRTDNLLFRNILTYLSNKSEDSPYGSFGTYARMNPYWEAVDERGNVRRWVEVDPNIPNPMYNATIGTLLSDHYREFIDNLYAEWTIMDGLHATMRLGVTNNKSGSDSFYPADHTRFSSGSTSSVDPTTLGEYTWGNGEKINLSGDLNLRYSRSIGKNFFFINAGTQVSETNSSFYSHTAEGFPNSIAADITFARRYKPDQKPSGSSFRNREASFLLAASYDYDSRYLADATVRESASSLYGNNNRWANSWSAGLGWNLHNEPWMKSATQIKQLKLRASVGLTGNQNFNTNAAVATYRYYTGKVYAGRTGAYLSIMPNPDLKWEQKMDYNCGLDARLFGLNLSLDLYRAETQNMLTDLTIPTSTGFGIVKDNLGLVRNTGFELKTNYTILQNEDGFFNVFGTLSSNKNYIVRLSESLRTYNENILKKTSSETASRPVILYQDGLSMTTIWAVPSVGIDPGSGDEIFIKQDGSFTYEYDPTDLRPLGDSSPKYRGTFGFSGEYKGLGISAVCSYLAGGELYNSTLVDRVENADIAYNVDRRLAEGRWRTPGQITRFKKLNSYVHTRPSSRFIQKRNELQISSISLYYELPKEWYRKLKMENMRLSLYMNDLATFSSIQVERGTDYPFARRLSMSLNMVF